MVNNELYHYGVKGMKWGVRHDRSYRVKKKQERREKKYPDYYRSKKMSDDDLKKSVQRLRMEKEYRTLKQEERESINTGKRIKRTLEDRTINSLGTRTGQRTAELIVDGLFAAGVGAVVAYSITGKSMPIKNVAKTGVKILNLK